MKRFTINIPQKNEVKDFFMYLFSWITRTGRMKRNSKVMNELFKDLCDEINSGYWSKDISNYMKKELTDPMYGKIREMIIETKRRLI